MKRFLLLFGAIATILFTGCEKDDDSGTQTFFVNVYKTAEWQGEVSKEELVDNAFVYLFINSGKIINDEKSVQSVVIDGEITYNDGTTAKPTYTTKFQPGVFNMENINNGEYILWVTYGVSSRFYSSYKSIVVNYDYRGTMEKKVFHTKFEDTSKVIQPW